MFIILLMLSISNETLNINCNPNDNLTHTTILMLMEKDGKSQRNRWVRMSSSGACGAASFLTCDFVFLNFGKKFLSQVF